MEKEKLVIIGDGPFAQIAFEYFTHDSAYQVVGFSVERSFLKRKELFGIPIIPFEELEYNYDPKDIKVFVAITYGNLNRIRERLFREAKLKGFSTVSYVSSKAFVWNNVRIGENCFIFENNTLQPWVNIHDNVILWSGNHIGHHSVIKSHCFISSHVVISGFCEIGEYCFLGVNSTIINNLKIGKNCVIGAGAVVTNDTEEGKVYVGNPAKPLRRSSFEVFQVR